MKYKFSLLIICLSCLVSPSATLANAMDSLRIETRDGSNYIVHKVDKGETLYSLARRYKVSVSKIQKANKSNSGLAIGQILYVPYSGSIPHSPSLTSSGRTHAVKPGETLYSISRAYSISVTDIRNWNNLTSNNLEIGQILVVSNKAKDVRTSKPGPKKQSKNDQPNYHVVSKGETLYSISRKYSVDVTDIKKWNSLSSNSLEIGDKLKISANQSSSIQKSIDADQAASDAIPVKTEKIEVNNSSDNLSGIDPIEEEGFAAPIDEDLDTQKYLCLHKSAPVGTIIKLKNEMNNSIAFVRVVGKLPDTGVNKNILIRVSKPAYEQLGGIDNKFPIVASYIP